MLSASWRPRPSRAICASARSGSAPAPDGRPRPEERAHDAADERRQHDGVEQGLGHEVAGSSGGTRGGRRSRSAHHTPAPTRSTTAPSRGPARRPHGPQDRLEPDVGADADLARAPIREEHAGLVQDEERERGEEAVRRRARGLGVAGRAARGGWPLEVGGDLGDLFGGRGHRGGGARVRTRPPRAGDALRKGGARGSRASATCPRAGDRAAKFCSDYTNTRSHSRAGRGSRTGEHRTARALDSRLRGNDFVLFTP